MKRSAFAALMAAAGTLIATSHRDCLVSAAPPAASGTAIVTDAPWDGGHAAAGVAFPDCTLGLEEHDVFASCIAGPGNAIPPATCNPEEYDASDVDRDDDVDLDDFRLLQNAFGGGTESWELQPEILDAPTNATQCSTTRWKVSITNIGTATSLPTCLLTAICATTGPENWRVCVSSLRLFTIPSLAPGESLTHSVDSYIVRCDTPVAMHYVKAGTRVPSPCQDPCVGFDESPIAIGP